MEYSKFSCDVCDTEEGDVSHWFAISAFNELIFTVRPWEEAARDKKLSSAEHICGQECLHKRLSQWLEINSRTMPTT